MVSVRFHGRGRPPEQVSPGSPRFVCKVLAPFGLGDVDGALALKGGTQCLRIAFFIDSLVSGGAQRQCVELAVGAVAVGVVSCLAFCP